MIRELSGGRLILASGSPRRREILSGAGLKFEIVESGVDERLLAGEGARDFALRMSEEKALTVSQKFLDALVIGADTVVEIDGKILGKPRDPEDARSMLNLLSARTHNVITAFAIARNSQTIERASVMSRVTFRRLTADEISSYLETDEPYDKAGAYAVQGIAADFIAKIEGSRSNVMGLPSDEALVAIERAGRADNDG